MFQLFSAELLQTYLLTYGFIYNYRYTKAKKDVRTQVTMRRENTI